MKKTISLKARTIIVSLGSSFILIFVLFGFIYVLISQGFKNLEITFSQKDVARAKESYNSIISNYEKKVIDWALWDDTYQFIDDLNETYIESNLVPSTLQNIQVDNMLFYGLDGRIKHAVDTTGSTPANMDDLLLSNTKIFDELKTKMASNGLVRISGSVFLYTGHAILTSDGEGDPRGYIFFCRRIGDWLPEDLSRLIQLPVTWDRVDIHNVTVDNPTVFETEKIYAHIWLPIINDPESFRLQIEIQRNIWAQGVKSMTYLLTALIVVAIAGAFVNYYLFYVNIIRDILKFKSNVSELAQNEGRGEIQETGENLEIDSLRRDLNMLLKLMNEFRNQAENKARDLDSANRLMIGREVKMAEMKKNIFELRKKII